MKKKNIGFLSLLFGFLFLSSPDIIIFDILPDFIGYIFILSGLSRLADIDERAADAKKLAKRLLVLAAVKFVFSFYLGALQKTNLLLVVFSLAILDLILILPFLKEFFHSIDYTATRQGVMLSSKKLSETRLVFVFFFILKDILMVLPSTVSLVDPSETGDYSSNLWYIDFKALTNVLTVISFFFMILLGLFMAVWAVRFFVYLLKNHELCRKLYENYERSVLLVPSRVISKGARQTSALLISSFFFLVDFYVDFIDVLPSVVGFLLILIYSLAVQKKLKINTVCLTVTSSLGTLISLFAFVYRFYWHRKLQASVEFAFSDKRYTLILAIGVSVFLLVSFSLALVVLSKLKETYAGERDGGRTVVLILLSAILAAFNFILYAFPEKNAAFVFPNVIFAAAFVFISYDSTKAVLQGILNKNRDF